MVTYFSLVDLFTSMKCTPTVDTFCRHHLLALASITLNVFQQHIYHTLLWTSLLAAYNMWDTPQVPHPFITISDTILFTIPATCCCASIISRHLTSSNAELYSCVAVSPDLSSFLCFYSLSELEVVLTSVTPGQDMRLASRQHVTVHSVSQSHGN
jgi:hypothetical protein